MRRWWIALLAGCGTGPAPAEAPPEPSPGITAPEHRIRLFERRDDVVLELPPTNLPPDRVAGLVTLRGDFEAEGRTDGGREWSIPLPFHADWVELADARPEGLTVTGPSGRLPFSATSRPGTWRYADGRLHVTQSRDAAAPVPRAWKVRHDGLEVYERGLSLQTSRLDPAAFALRRMTTPTAAWDGVYLPAPATATWTLEAPAGARFEAEVRLIDSPIAGTGSDGATVVLEVQVAGGWNELARVEATHGGARLTAALQSQPGVPLALRLRTDPGATRYYDYVHVVDPVIIAPRGDARHVILVQLDAVPRDALAPWGGGARGALDGLAPAAAVFDEAWTPAPWTLPATRALLAGDEPEHWEQRAILPERLAASGFATWAIFDDPATAAALDRGWTGRVALGGAPVATAVEAAEEIIARHQGRDLFVLLQLGAAQRVLAPAPAEALEPWQVTTSRGGGHHGAAIAEVVEGLRPLVEGLADDAWLVVYADHGAELRPRGHADRLTEAVSRVPLLVRGPGVVADRYPAPVSLVDLAPTVLDAMGLLPPADVSGRSLLPLLRGEEGADAGLASRPIVIGRTRGAPTWGVVLGGARWIGGVDEILVGTDDATPLRAALAESLAATPKRVMHVRGELPVGATVHVSHPGGFEGAWRALPDGQLPQALELTEPLVWRPVDAAEAALGLLVAPRGDPAALVVEAVAEGASPGGVSVTRGDGVRLEVAPRWVPVPPGDGRRAMGPR